MNSFLPSLSVYYKVIHCELCSSISIEDNILIQSGKKSQAIFELYLYIVSCMTMSSPSPSHLVCCLQSMLYISMSSSGSMPMFFLLPLLYASFLCKLQRPCLLLYRSVSPSSSSVCGCMNGRPRFFSVEEAV